MLPLCDSNCILVAMHILQILGLGLVEGFTEFLPISSTAHLMMTSRLLHSVDFFHIDFLKTFEIIVQFGAILAIIFLYWPRLRALQKIWLKIMAAFVPTGIIGFLLYKTFKDFLIGNNEVAIWALGIGGALLVLFEIFYKDKKATSNSLEELAALPYAKVVLIGCAQSISIIPGVSRSAVTIVAGRALGVSRRAIVEFSFLLAVPTMLAASGYELLNSTPHLSAPEYGYIGLGLIVAFVTAFVSVRWFLRYIQNHNFITFGIYRVIVAFAFIPFL